MIAGRRRGILNRVQGCIKKPKRYIQDVKMNYTLMNCQSLKNKLDSLVTNFKMNGNVFLIANETWFKKKDPQLSEMLSKIEDRDDIYALRKDRKLGRTGRAHGGVAVFYDSTKCSLKKFPLNALRGNDVRDFEILAVRGNLKGVKRAGDSHILLLLAAKNDQKHGRKSPRKSYRCYIGSESIS